MAAFAELPRELPFVPLMMHDPEPAQRLRQNLTVGVLLGSIDGGQCSTAGLRHAAGALVGAGSRKNSPAR